MPVSLDPFLVSLGWSAPFQVSFDEVCESENLKLSPARVIGQGRGHYHIQAAHEVILEAAITSKFHSTVTESTDFPTVGDWVMFAFGNGNQQATIQHVLKRKNVIQRRRSGAQQGLQLIAANIDYLLIVSSPNEDFSLPRLNRYVALGREAACEIAILLTKADLYKNPSEFTEKLKNEFKELEVFATSSKDTPSMDQLEKFFTVGKTSVLLGSSGVGKSTLTNYLLGFESQKTQEVSADSRGRHTTTARNLRFTRWGGLVIDTPGMQEIATLDPEEELQNNFSDIDELTLRCKFTNCQHKSEPGCAILSALKKETLTTQRWNMYLAAVDQASRRR